MLVIDTRVKEWVEEFAMPPITQTAPSLSANSDWASEFRQEQEPANAETERWYNNVIAYPH